MKRARISAILALRSGIGGLLQENSITFPITEYATWIALSAFPSSAVTSLTFSYTHANNASAGLFSGITFLSESHFNGWNVHPLDCGHRL